MDTIKLPASNHTITVRAIDKAGNPTETSIPVTIQSQLAVAITSPVTGTTINKTTAIIKGKIIQNADKEVGVIINGVLVHVQGKIFAAIVPLQQGQSTITATATDADGLTAQAVIAINTNILQEQVRLTVNPNSGIPTMKSDGTTSFDANLEAETYLPNAVANWTLGTLCPKWQIACQARSILVNLPHAASSPLDVPEALHHIMVRGINKSNIFHDDEDKAKFLERLGTIATILDLTVGTLLSYVIFRSILKLEKTGG